MKATKHKNKYSCLFSLLEKAKIIEKRHNHWECVAEFNEQKVIYVAPGVRKPVKHLIIFHDAADKLRGKGEFEDLFATYQCKWQDYRAGDIQSDAHK